MVSESEKDSRLFWICGKLVEQELPDLTFMVYEISK